MADANDTPDASKDIQDDSMSIEERLVWLRERGVQIETPEERKVSQVASAIRQAGVKHDEVTTSYVYIPCDSTKPLRELTYDSSSSGGSLLDYLKPNFKSLSGAAVDLSRVDDNAATLLSSDSSVPQVSEATLQKVAKEAHVEVFTVVHPAKDNPSLVFYLDEIGALKRLPVNARASQYAERAGYNPSPTFYGDIYASRICPRTQRNLSCHVEDLEHVHESVLANLEHQLEQNRLTGRVDAQQPAIAGSAGSSKQEDGFTWRQTEQDLEVIVVLPSANVTTKQVKVVFRPLVLKITVPSPPAVFSLELQLFEKVDVDSCTWTLGETKTKEGEPRRELIVSMEKVEEALWPRIRD